MTSSEGYDQTVIASYNSDAGEQENRRSDLSALVMMGLGKALDDQTFHRLLDAQSQLRDTQYALIDKMKVGDMPPDMYVEHLNEALKLWTSRSIAIVGHDTFIAIFGEDAFDLDSSEDRSMFLEQMGNSAPR